MRQEGGQIHLAVIDTGIGIAADRLDRIFDAFAQADASTTRRFGGTGLGTTISRRLVERMGGRITVESEVDQGSTFHVWLPLPAGDAARAESDATEVAVTLPPPAPAGGGRRGAERRACCRSSWAARAIRSRWPRTGCRR